MFFAAVDIARECRNMVTHAHKHKPNNKDKTGEKTDKFNELAVKKHRPELCWYYDHNDPRYEIEALKYYIRVITWAHDWVSEYAKRYGQREDMHV